MKFIFRKNYLIISNNGNLSDQLLKKFRKQKFKIQKTYGK